MSSSISALERLQTDTYISFVMIPAVIYDYLLTFPREVRYVWRKPWTWVSLMFVLVRYTGLTFAMIYPLFGSTFLPGPHRVSRRVYPNLNYELYRSKTHSCNILYLVMMICSFTIFLTAADFVMILRVYAMWKRSKIVLYVLVFLYVIQLVVSVVLDILYYYNKTHVSVIVHHVFDISFCTESFVDTPAKISLYVKLPRLTLATALLVLAVIQNLKHTIEMYTATKRWQPNRYMQVLARDGIVYFLLNVLINVLNWVRNINANSIWILCLYSFCWTAICAMMPRFIIDVRSMCDRDFCGRSQGIDSGFGVILQPMSSHNPPMSEIGFADAHDQSHQTAPGEEQLEEIRLTEWVRNVIPSPIVDGDADDLEDIRVEERRGNI